MQPTAQTVTKAQARSAKLRIFEVLLEKYPGLRDCGIGISHDNNGYAVKLHLSHPMSEDTYDIVCKAADGVPVTTEITEEDWAF